ncbi:hypothetical protein BHE74_00025997 [Ensete ventricosum]|nr:hypothetical protein BHE74_00025997 [Ensete ventricosum]
MFHVLHDFGGRTASSPLYDLSLSLPCMMLAWLLGRGQHLMLSSPCYDDNLLQFA